MTLITDLQNATTDPAIALAIAILRAKESEDG